MPAKPSSVYLGVALAAASIALSGCGSGGASASISKSQAAAYAAHVNLRASDLPEMTANGPEHDATNESRGEDGELGRCLGDPAISNEISKIKSPSFRGEAPGRLEQIQSTVELQPTQALAQESDRLVLSARGLRCLSRLIPRQFASASGPSKFGRVSIKRLAKPLPSVAASFGIRISTSVAPAADRGRQIPVYVDLYGFVSGNAEVALMTFATPQPVSAKVAARLLATLYGRAVAYKS
ncbi:MAG TPA: hypothetical protein VK761_08285 [Solirubrobacteraceae bacterium]|jgi:hypothetical protein|nr:hypothetical protein [Solirubrobacteraceae bacterium]